MKSNMKKIKIQENKAKINEEVLYIENNYLFLRDKKYIIEENYNIIDAIRDYFIDKMELCNHNNLQDIEYVNNINGSIPLNIEFELDINNKNMYIYFISTILIHTMDNYEKQCKNFVFSSENNNIFEIYSLSDKKEKGALIFKKENVNNSFFDLYDYFDLLYVLLCSIKKEIGYEYKNISQEVSRDLFIEL